jgi:hypothetical protein
MSSEAGWMLECIDGVRLYEFEVVEDTALIGLLLWYTFLTNLCRKYGAETSL